MIIACPECTGPFELRDEHISALVQLECPSCRFRMILDFAAANDASLVEEGMQMASGFRSAADYHASIAGGPAAVRTQPLLQPVAAPEPVVAPEPAPAPAPAPEPAPEPTPAAEPAAELPAPEPAPAATPEVAVEPAAAAPNEVRSTMIGMRAPELTLPEAKAPVVTLEPAVDIPDFDDDGPTRVHGLSPFSPEPAQPEPTPEPEPEPEASPVAVEAERPVARAPEPAAPAAEPEPAPEPEPEPEPKPTPAPEAKPAPEPSAPKKLDAPSMDAFDELDDPAPAGSPFGTFIVAMLVMVALGLVGASVAMKGTPDPRPLLEDLYRQYLM